MYTQWHIIQNYTVLHSLCTLLFVIGQGIISITQSSCRFSRFHKNNYYRCCKSLKKITSHYRRHDNQSIFYSISDTYSVIHIIHSKFTINKKQRRGEKDMFEAIQLIITHPNAEHSLVCWQFSGTYELITLRKV